jgi:hypothetical protein
VLCRGGTVAPCSPTASGLPGLRRVALRALDAYPLVEGELRFVADEENTTFRVDATTPGGRDRFLLRMHRPARHGRNVDSAAAIGSELVWLTALRAGTDLLVPVPFRTVGGKPTDGGCLHGRAGAPGVLRAALDGWPYPGGTAQVPMQH